MSAYLAFRYIEKDEMKFAEGIQHRTNVRINLAEKVLVKNAEETSARIVIVGRNGLCNSCVVYAWM